MTVIGITGGTGAGKTTALDVLEKMGACIIDCDEVYHDLLENSAEMIKEIRDRFPGAFIDGIFVRKQLGRIVFSSHDDLEALNEITGKYVLGAVCGILNKERAAGREAAAVDAIGLFEGRLDALCDVTVAVTASKDTRAKRIMARENISREYADLRISAQKPDSFFKENCDYVLINDYETKDEFNDYCEKFFEEMLRRNGNG